MTVCQCLYPSIVCRALDDGGPHNGATSRQITDIMAAFKLKMGMSDYAILNELLKKEEMMVIAQQGQAAADHDNAEQVAEGEQEVAPSSGSDTTDCWHIQQHSHQKQWLSAGIQ